MKRRSAVEYDLLTLTGHELDDLGRTLSWRALHSFLEHLPPDSAVVLEEHPEFAPWMTTLKTNVILADLIDMVGQLNANMVAKGTGKRAQRVKPYQRPKPDERQHIGKGALPHDELMAWFEEKRKQHGGNG